MLKGNNYICSLKKQTMKFIRFFLALSFIIPFLNTFSQTVLLNENFDSGIINNWDMIDGDMSTPYNDPQVSILPNSFHLVADYDSLSSGDSVMAATSWFDDTTSANNFLISPLLNLPTTGNFLNFQAMSVDGSYPDGLQIYYAYNNSNIDSLMVNEVLFDTIAIPSVSTNFQVNLSDIPLNTDFYIVFRHYATNQYILSLDNISVVTNDLTTIEDIKEPKVLIYPNPSDGKINISSYQFSSSAAIYNTIGNKIWEGKLNNPIELNFNSGFYFLQYQNKSIPFVIK